MVTKMTPLHTQSRGWMQSRSMMQMHTMVEAVLTLPDHPAAMTRPLSTAIIRRAETASSRAMTTTKIHAGIRPQLTNMDIVCDGIHEFAEIRDLVAVTGDVAVQKIAEGGQNKDGQGNGQVVGEIQVANEQKEGDQDYPEQCNFIGCVQKDSPASVSSISPIISPSATSVNRTGTKVPAGRSPAAVKYT